MKNFFKDLFDWVNWNAAKEAFKEAFKTLLRSVIAWVVALLGFELGVPNFELINTILKNPWSVWPIVGQWLYVAADRFRFVYNELTKPSPEDPPKGLLPTFKNL